MVSGPFNELDFAQSASADPGANMQLDLLCRCQRSVYVV